VAHHRGDQPWPASGAATWRLIAPGGNLIERAPVEIATIATTTRQRQLTSSLQFMLTEHVAFVLIYRGGQHSAVEPEKCERGSRCRWLSLADPFSTCTSGGPSLRGGAGNEADESTQLSVDASCVDLHAAVATPWMVSYSTG
jgi:hypothetical protein